MLLSVGKCVSCKFAGRSMCFNPSSTLVIGLFIKLIRSPSPVNKLPPLHFHFVIFLQKQELVAENIKKFRQDQKGVIRAVLSQILDLIRKWPSTLQREARTFISS